MDKFKPRVLIDFDGVLTHYTKWIDETTIKDPPNKDMIEVLDSLRSLDFEIVIFSTRAKTIEGRNAIRKYCYEHGFAFDRVTDKKEPAKVLLDDRAICFDGNTENLMQKIIEFKPYRKDRKDDSSE